MLYNFFPLFFLMNDKLLDEMNQTIDEAVIKVNNNKHISNQEYGYLFVMAHGEESNFLKRAEQLTTKN